MRRGVTLLELIIAVALLIGLAAIAVPSVLRELEARAYEDTVQVVTNQLLLARAHAQRTGRVVEVVYREAGAHVVARRFDPALDAEDPDVAFGTDADRGAAVIDTRVIYEGWADRPLPAGVTIGREPPAELVDTLTGVPAASITEPGFDVEAPGPPRGFDDLSPSETIRLAVYLPDGSTLLAEPFWLSGAGGRTGAVGVNPWTGLPSYTPGAAAVSSPDDAEDEPEEDADDAEIEAADAETPGAIDDAAGAVDDAALSEAERAPTGAPTGAPTRAPNRTPNRAPNEDNEADDNDDAGAGASRGGR